MNLIGNNPSLNEVQKLCYLKGALKNEASLIQSDQDTFDSLLKALEVRYENTRALVDIHIAEILSINKLNSENPSQIRSIIDKVRNHLRYLKNLNFESNPLSDAIILHVLSNKVDKESQRLFHLSLTTTKVPSLDEFISFLELRCIQLEAVIKPPEIVAKNVPIKNKPTPGLINPRWKSFLTKEKLKPTTSVESIQGQRECLICHKENKHPIFNCESFLNHSPLERYKLCKKNNICTNCLNYHPDKKCVSTSRCKICNKFHNTKLHREKEIDSLIASSPTPGEASKVNTEQCFATNADESPRVKYMLSTAIIYINNIPVRIILDSGSEINLIDSDSATTLGLKRNKINSTVSGFNGLAQKINYSVSANISNRDGSFNQHLKFLVVPNISSFTPSCTLDITKISFPKHIELADPSFYKPSKVSMLLGAQVFFKIIKADQIKINDSVTLQNSVFNYIVTGGLPAVDDKHSSVFFFLNKKG
ncbi:DUF1758 domain-containing protein [Trichonephila clavipes]|nr:DUF1758 domain-containing protein [Trichonephila clavipes]